MTAPPDWMQLHEGINMAKRRFPDALRAIVSVHGRELTSSEVIAAIRHLCESGKVSMMTIDAGMRRPLELSSLKSQRIHWEERGFPVGQVSLPGGVALPILLNGPDLVLALDAMMPERPLPEAPEVEGITFLDNGQAIADFGAALRLVERYRDAWEWIMSPVRNANLAEWRLPHTAAAMLQAMFDPGAGIPFSLFGLINGQWQELPDSAEPLFADVTGERVGLVRVKRAGQVQAAPVGFPLTPLAHHLDALNAEAEARRRRRQPNPEAETRAREEAEKLAQATVERAKKRAEAAEAMAKAEERERAERLAAERRRVASLFAAPAPSPAAPEATAKKPARA
jgi:hypothetical protein